MMGTVPTRKAPLTCGSLLEATRFGLEPGVKGGTVVVPPEDVEEVVEPLDVAPGWGFGEVGLS